MLRGQKLQLAYDDYIINYSREKGLNPKSVENKKYTLRSLIPFLNGKPMTLETCRTYALYLFDHGWNSPNSRVNVIKNLRAFVNFLFKYKYLKENFAQELIKPKIPRTDFPYIDPETVEKIIIAGTELGVGDNTRSKWIKQETRTALRFLLRTGLRINELLTLQGNDLNVYDKPPTFWVNSKGGNRELLPLPIDMLEELQKRMTNKRVFAVTKETCNDVLQRGAKALGLSVRITNHSLRHIFASNLVKNKTPIQMVSRLMRHSSVEITDKTYTHLDVNDLSLILNSTQVIIKEGLTVSQIFENLEKVVTQTGIATDKRFKTQVLRKTNEFIIRVLVTNS